MESRNETTKRMLAGAKAAVAVAKQREAERQIVVEREGELLQTETVIATDTQDSNS